jgi:3-hydroxyisobutyrate dehydrogenase-like beta-hydroxyacid dehydrogenase
VGHQVTVWNRSKEPVDELVRLGAKGAQDICDTFQAEVVMSILFDDDAIRASLLGPAGLVKAKT